MNSGQISVRLAIEHKEVRNTFEEIISQIGGFSLQKFKDSKPLDILIVEVGRRSLAEEIQQIRLLQVSGEAEEIFLTSSRQDPDLFIQVLKTGIKEFFLQPINPEEVRQALLRVQERKSGTKPARAAGKIIYLMGSRGGVGTTLVAVNLAINLQQLGEGHSVALIDMKLFFSEIPLFLDLQPTFDWGEIVKNINRADSTYLMSVLSKHRSGIHVLPAPTGLNDLRDTPKVYERLWELLKNTFDFIVIDGGQSLSNASFKVLELSDFVLVIGELNLFSLTNIKRLLGAFKDMGFPGDKVRIIINRYQKNSIISPKETEKSINKKIFWFIPNDNPTTNNAINQGRSLLEIDPKAEISKNLRQLAYNFTEFIEEGKAIRTWNV